MYCLYRRKNTGIFIPSQERILSILRLRFFNISPPSQKLFVGQHPRELASNRSIHKLHYIEIRRKEDIEVSLMYLRNC